MSRNIGHEPIATRFEHLLKAIGSQRFLTMQGNNNEVPFFICDYNPAEAVDMIRLQKQLVNRLDQAGVRVLEVNLYDLSIDMIKARGLWDRVLEVEPTVTKDEFKEMLQNILDPEAHLVPEIGRRIEAAEYDVLFLSGVGEVFPYIRSQGGEIPTKLKSAGPDGFRRAPNKFVTAMVKLLVAIAMSAGRKRIPFDVNKMPGMVEDLREVAIEFDSTFGSYGIETFKEYMLPLCNFTRGRKKRNDTDFYKKVLPLYFKNTQVIKLEPPK